MKENMSEFLFTLWIFMVFSIVSVSMLKCWKCIQHDCDKNPDGNYRAIRQTCEEGESCLKVRYQMFDNYTYYDATTLTCSSGKCEPTTEEDYEICLQTVRKYIVSGCALRKCCDDKDFCNKGHTIVTDRSLQILSFLILLSQFRNPSYV